MKLINNMLCAVQAAGLAEALALAEKSGLAMDSVLDILTNGAPGSPMVKTLSKRMVDRNYDVNFYLHLMAKDVDYAIKLSENLWCFAQSSRRCTLPTQSGKGGRA